MKLSLNAYGCLLSLSIALPLAACAAPSQTVVDNRNGKLVHVSRQDLRFAAQPYEVSHERAHPRAPGASGGQMGDGGAIRGRVCGAALDLSVEHRGDHVALRGQVDGAAARLRVEDRAGERNIRGFIGDRSVELFLDGEQVAGRLADQPLRYSRQGDELIAAQAGGQPVQGGAGLWRMPPADQAAVLPLLLLCAQAPAAPAPQGALDVEIEPEPEPSSGVD